MGKMKATVMVCDNPSCGAQAVTTKDDPALGYYFGAGSFHLAWGGGGIPAIYACSDKCIKPAVVYVTSQALADR